MTWSEYLAAQLDRSREISLYVIQDFEEDDFYQKIEHVNPGIWTLGHMAGSEPGIVYTALNEPIPRPESWSEYFNIGAKLLDDLHQYPPLSEVRQVLEEGHLKTQERIKQMSEADLNAPAHPDMQVFPWLKTIRDAISLALIHESNHGGQLIWLRKLLGKPGLF